MDLMAAKKYYKSDPNLFAIRQNDEKKKNTLPRQIRDQLMI
jgi:hypothetical protein